MQTRFIKRNVSNERKHVLERNEERTMSVIELNDVSVTFHEGGRTVEAVKHVNISVEKGEIFGIVGFSGAGKSTLVRTINLLERPTGGHVVIDGSDITALKGGQLRDLRKKIGFIFQGFNLITNVTVGKNIEFALKAGGYPNCFKSGCSGARILHQKLPRAL